MTLDSAVVYAGLAMRSNQVRSILFLAASGVAAFAAFANRGSLLVAGLLGVLALGLVKLAAASFGEDRSSALHDPGVSTLVFPPESRFEQSVLPKR